MPELPEVETTRRGIAPHIEGQRLTAVKVRNARLRWPIAADLPARLTGRLVVAVRRRAKYLLFELDDSSSLLVHLGMSGSLRVLAVQTPPGKHDHIDLVLDERCVRLRDPRRFGAVLWTPDDPSIHPRLAHLGPEPLSADFCGNYLHRRARGRRLAVKQLLMDGKVVVGVGNIYANEALFRAGIRPHRAAGSISLTRLQRLAEEVKAVLNEAINQGGTTLRDFQREDGSPGYFRIQLRVYGRGGRPCLECGKPLTEVRIGQRSTVYCTNCQR